MTARLRLFVAAIVVLPGAAALAEPRLRPGLWEETVTVKSDNAQANAAMAQMKERLAALPPEQRAAMEQMMASRGIGVVPGAPNTFRICLTQAQIDRGFRPEGNGRCTRANVNSSGNVTLFDFACKTERGNVTGHGRFTATGDSAFAVSTTAENTTANTTTHMDTDVAGRFVSGDCGTVKPAADVSR